jgi:hypothetical protein
MLSLLLYILTIISAFFYPVVSVILIVSTAVLWIIPDKNIENALKE